jgi:hypothetical protein
VAARVSKLVGAGPQHREVIVISHSPLT